MSKNIAFICVHNSCRSQIAEALGNRFAGDVFKFYSAGTETKPHINQDAVRIMKEIYGIDMEKNQYSKTISDIPEPDIAISMGCNVGCPFIKRGFDEDWGLEDPTGKSDEDFIKIIKEIERRVLQMVIKEMFDAGYNCAQIVSTRFASKYGMDSRELKRLTCGFGGGMRKGEVCGAVSGATLVVGMKYGNENAKEVDKKKKCHDKTIEYENHMIKKTQSLICKDYLGCDISEEEGYEYAIQNNLFNIICPKMIFESIQTLIELGY